MTPQPSAVLFFSCVFLSQQLCCSSWRAARFTAGRENQTSGLLYRSCIILFNHCNCMRLLLHQHFFPNAGSSSCVGKTLVSTKPRLEDDVTECWNLVCLLAVGRIFAQSLGEIILLVSFRVKIDIIYMD